MSALARSSLMLLGSTLISVGLSGCGLGNQQACLDYLNALNAAQSQCGLPQYDEAAVCPASLNHSADCSDYYKRLETAVVCSDPVAQTVKYDTSVNGTAVSEGPSCF